MLIHLHVQDFALIERLEFTPDTGLTVITGETGAGKSILIDAILSLLGGRMSKDLIRSGQSACRIDALFQVGPDQIPPDLQETLSLQDAFSIQDDSHRQEAPTAELLLSREYSVNGRSVFRANDRLITAATARSISAALFDIHGQHDNQLIFDPSTHLALLDRFSGLPVLKAREAWLSILAEWRQCSDRLAELGADPAARARLIDTLQFQTAEIEAANIKPQEDEQLQEQRRIRQNQEKIVKALSEASALLSGEEGGAVRSLGEAAARVDFIGRYSEKLGRLRQPLSEAIELAQSVSADLADALQRIDLDPHALERIDERLDVLYRLKSKYGGTLEQVQAYYRKAVAKRDTLKDGEQQAQILQKELERIRERLLDAGRTLRRAREKAASDLSERICHELADLGMKSVRFSVRFDAPDLQPPYREDGLDRIEFLLSPNPGEPERPLARIASGGEAARIMLAIKAILADADQTPILIFDEIDTGVSGKTALRVAEKLSGLSSGRQVFCITHLPQIAAMADHHFLIEKTVSDNKTRTQLHQLTHDDRRQEIARLLSGDAGAGKALSLADEMLQSADAFRQSSRR